VISRITTAQPWLSTVGRLALALVWFLAGWPKFLDSAGTVRSVRNFRLLPEALVPTFGYTLPLVELALGLLLLLGLGTRLAAALTALMMVVFIVGIASAWARGLQIECGCFGSTGTAPLDPVAGYVRDIARDTAYLAVAAALVRWPHSRLSVDALLGITHPARRDSVPADV
jgi:uncharacterized membrane protein YphA (DoxX/SURF4 family)